MNILPEDRETATELNLEILVAEEETCVYVKISGFEEMADVEKYADWLEDNLPFLLYQSKVIH